MLRFVYKDGSASAASLAIGARGHWSVECRPERTAGRFLLGRAHGIRIFTLIWCVGTIAAPLVAFGQRPTSLSCASTEANDIDRVHPPSAHDAGGAIRALGVEFAIFCSSSVMSIAMSANSAVLR